jgi:hypothetical protein
MQSLATWRYLYVKRLAGGESDVASAFQFPARSAWISCCRPASMSFA